MTPEVINIWESGRMLLFHCVKIPEVIGTDEEILNCSVRTEQTEFLPYEPEDKRPAEAYLKDWVSGGLTKVQKKIQQYLRQVKRGIDERQKAKKNPAPVDAGNGEKCR